MARIAGVDLPRNKRIEIALTYIYGLGRHAANVVLDEGGHLARQEERRPRRERTSARSATRSRQNYRVEGDLRRDMQLNIKRLIDLGCYRGLRHRRNLPARGQRTHTNARTRKGPRRMAVKKMGAVTKK